MKLRARLAWASIAVATPLLAALYVYDARARHDAATAVLRDLAEDDLRDAQATCEADPRSARLDPHGPGGSGPGGSGPGGSGPGGSGPGGSRPPHGPPPDGPPPDGAPPDAPNLPDAGLSPPGGPDQPHGRPPATYAFDATGHPASPDAPAVDPASFAAAATPGKAIALPVPWYDDDVRVLLRTTWGTGPCAYVLVEGSTSPGWLGAVLPATWVWVTPLAAVFGVVLLAAGPMIGRVRRLTHAVRSSGASHSGAFTVPLELDGDDEIAELARAFDETSRALRAQIEATAQRERALREFLANTTHDVMIPLTVLQGHLASLHERALADGPPESPAPPALTSAMGEAHYLAGILHNLAASARLDAAAGSGGPTGASLPRGPTDLGALVERVVARHRPIAQSRSIALEGAVPEAPLVVEAEVTLLEQAVSNLVYNAVRYNHPGGHVAIVLEPIPGGFDLRVVDDGPGISDMDLARIHRRGFRTDEARSRAPGGQGLGLDIASRVAELHGYTLRFSRSSFGGLEARLTSDRDAWG